MQHNWPGSEAPQGFSLVDVAVGLANMMRRIRLALTGPVLLLLLAGCMASPDPRILPEPIAGSSDNSYSLGDCVAWAGEFRVDAELVAGSLAEGFQLERDATGLRAVLTITVLSCNQELFDYTLPVVPPDAFANSSVNEYRMSEGAFIEGSDLRAYYARLGLNESRLAAIIETSEDPVAGELAQGRVIAEAEVATFTMEWARQSSAASEPARVIRTFVQDNESDPPTLLGYCDETWASRTSTPTGVARVDTDIPLTPLFIPPGTIVHFGLGPVSFDCQSLAGLT